jgi:hypothetical protein
MHWERVSTSIGVPFGKFLAKIRKLPKGQLWRHNQAGDLPGTNNRLDRKALAKLVKANKGKRGFTYTHKPIVSRLDRAAIRNANRDGFTINLSANDLVHADSLYDLGIAPVVAVLPIDVQGAIKLQTPNGRPVVVCPATYREEVTCATCGVCAVASRKSIIGFPVHGNLKRKYAAMLEVRSS